MQDDNEPTNKYFILNSKYQNCLFFLKHQGAYKIVIFFISYYIIYYIRPTIIIIFVSTVSQYA